MEDTTLMPIGNNSEIVIYQPDSTICLEVRMEAESVWLNLNQLSVLFQRDKSVISRHIRNIYSEGELLREATVANFATVQLENGRSVVSDLIRSAKERIVLFDNYVDDTVLTMLDKRGENVSATIYTKAVSAQLDLDLAKHNAQYRPIEVKEFDKVHDRFLCIDSTVYHIGASLKDLGKKWFAFSRMEMKAEEVMGKVSVHAPIEEKVL